MKTNAKNVNAFEWIMRSMKFNKARRQLIKHFKEEEDNFWVVILEHMHVPYFHWWYILEPTKMMAAFYVPGFFKKKVPIESFVCEVGYLREVFFYMLYVTGFTDEKIPKEIHSLMEKLD